MCDQQHAWMAEMSITSHLPLNNFEEWGQVTGDDPFRHLHNGPANNSIPTHTPTFESCQHIHDDSSQQPYWPESAVRSRFYWKLYHFLLVAEGIFCRCESIHVKEWDFYDHSVHMLYNSSHRALGTQSIYKIYPQFNLQCCASIFWHLWLTVTRLSSHAIAECTAENSIICCNWYIIIEIKSWFMHYLVDEYTYQNTAANWFNF